MKKKSEFKTFDDTMRKLVGVSHEEIKKKLEAEKSTKEAKRKRESNAKKQS